MLLLLARPEADLSPAADAADVPEGPPKWATPRSAATTSPVHAADQPASRGWQRRSTRPLPRTFPMALGPRRWSGTRPRALRPRGCSQGAAAALGLPPSPAPPRAPPGAAAMATPGVRQSSRRACEPQQRHSPQPPPRMQPIALRPRCRGETRQHGPCASRMRSRSPW